jgi:hypothetical protein
VPSCESTIDSAFSSNALVGNAVELALLYEHHNAKVRLVLIRLIDKHLAAYDPDAGAAFERALQAVHVKFGLPTPLF